MQISADDLVRLLGTWRAGDGLAGGLADRLAGLIRDGRLPAGTRLPAERPLAAALDVSRTTVAAALLELRTQNLVATRHGSGTRVRLAPDAALEAMTAWTVPPRHRQGELDWSAATPAHAPAEVHEAYRAALDRLPFTGTGYTAAGLAELRRAIADLYTGRGLATRPDQICVTAGAQQAIELVLRTELRTYDRVLVESPTYPGALDVLRARRARPQAVAVGTEWSMSTLLAGLRDPAYRLAYLMPGLHNPTGRSMPAEQRARLRDAAGTTDALILVDDVFADLATPPYDAPARFRRGTRVARVASLSKTVWGGLRVGWVRADRATVHRLAAEKSRSDLGSAVLEQLAAVDLLARYPELLARRRRSLAESVRRLRESLAAEVPALTVLSEGSGPSLWCRLPAGLTSTALTAAAARSGLRLVDASRFSPDGRTQRFVRLPVDLSPTDRPEAIRRLAEAVRTATR